jgi:hypothetical protein
MRFLSHKATMAQTCIQSLALAFSHKEELTKQVKTQKRSKKIAPLYPIYFWFPLIPLSKPLNSARPLNRPIAE